MLKVHSRAAAAAAALFVCALGAVVTRDAAAAAQFSVTPLLLNLPAGKLATALTLGNNGAAAVTVQAELVAWHQDAGDDAFAPAPGLVVSPPIFSLAPGAKQVVRIGRLKRGAAPARELAYRVRLAEVPPQAPEGGKAVSTYMQLTLPLFVPPADPKARPAVEFQATEAANRGLTLSIGNAGAVHDKVTRVTLSQDGRPFAERALNYYVLAGARRQLDWPAGLKAARPGPVEVKVHLYGRNRVLTQVLPREPRKKE